MKKTGRAVEMTGPWKTRKTKPRFPFVFPSPWKSLRDSHIPTAPARRGKVENQKQVSHFPTLLSSLSNPQNQTQERRPGAGSLRSRRSGSFFHEKMLQPDHEGGIGLGLGFAGRANARRQPLGLLRARLAADQDAPQRRL